MPTLASLGSATLGVWTRDQALRVVGRQVLERLLREGTWQTVFRGVYVDGGQVLTPEQRGVAAVLASGGADQQLRRGSEGSTTGLHALAAGRTAARVYGLPLIDDDDPATGGDEHLLDDVTVPTGLRHLEPAAPGLPSLLRHRAQLLPDSVWRTPGGLVLTSPVQVVVDCCRLLTLEAAICLVDAALHDELVTPEQLREAATALAGRPGAPRLTQVLSLADGRAEAPTESLARLLLLPVLPQLVPQVPLHDGRGRVVARFDLADKAARFAVETDGRRGHEGAVMVAKDQLRDLGAARQGWWTERATWYDVRRRQAELVARVLWRHAWHTSGRR